MICKNSGAAVLPSVHFSLRTEAGLASRVVESLHRSATSLGFLTVSDIAVFTDDHCAIVDNDFKTLKAHARGLVVEGRCVLSYMPNLIRGFECLMPNGNILAIGLCEYPESIEANGQTYRTSKPGEARWCSYVKTVVRDQTDPNMCYDSHAAVLSLLHVADSMAVLISVRDPYRQWEDPDDRRFRQGMLSKWRCTH